MERTDPGIRNDGNACFNRFLIRKKYAGKGCRVLNRFRYLGYLLLSVPISLAPVAGKPAYLGYPLFDTLPLGISDYRSSLHLAGNDIQRSLYA